MILTSVVVKIVADVCTYKSINNVLCLLCIHVHALTSLFSVSSDERGNDFVVSKISVYHLGLIPYTLSC